MDESGKGAFGGLASGHPRPFNRPGAIEALRPCNVGYYAQKAL